jgi:YcxB-like protein
VELEYEITPDDLYRFQWRANFHSPSAKRTKLKHLLYLFLIFTAFTLLPAFASDGFEISQVRLWWFLPFPVFVFIFRIVERWQTRRAILVLLKDEKPGRGQLGTHKVILNEAGLVESTAVGESRCLWAGVDRIEHDQQYIYIYTAPHAAHIIPKRAFNNLNEAESFYQLASVSKQAAAIAARN